MTAAFSRARKPGVVLRVSRIFVRGLAGGIHELPSQRGDAAEALQKIQRNALGGQDRASRAANFQDRLAAGERSSIRLEDFDVQLWIYAPKDFRGGFSARDDGAFARNNPAEGLLTFGNKELGRDVARADVFAQRDRDGIGCCVIHLRAVASEAR